MPWQKYSFNGPLGSRCDDTHSGQHVITLTKQHVCASHRVLEARHSVAETMTRGMNHSLRSHTRVRAHTHRHSLCYKSGCVWPWNILLWFLFRQLTVSGEKNLIESRKTSLSCYLSPILHKSAEHFLNFHRQHLTSTMRKTGLCLATTELILS